ncbi:MAG: hypothetical protein IID44_21720 [Planctomycetes bacterium]|nr:hypothetical protein [Planctomycetota bacterium]
MDALKKQVRRARRRLVLQQWVGLLFPCWGGAFLVALLLVGGGRIWPIGVDAWIWIGAAAGLGPLAAGVWTCGVRRSELNAALEIDRRFELKERVSSTLTLDADQLESPAGVALLRDAVERVEKLDVEGRFALEVRAWQPLAALAPALLAMLLVLLVEPAVRDNPAEAEEVNTVDPQVKRAIEPLSNSATKLRKRAAEEGLEDIEAPLANVERVVEKLAKAESLDKKKALLEINDLANQLEKRRKALGGIEQIRKQLQGLKTSKNGPGDRLAKALKGGDFKKAVDEVKKLQEKLAAGQLNEKQQQQLAEQIGQMRRKMQNAADAHAKAQDQIQKRVEEARQRGDTQQAEKLQRQLDKLQQQAPQMDRLRQMAQKLGECEKCLRKGQQGDAKAQAQAQARAAEQLASLADELKQLQKDAAAMELLDESLQQLSQAKESMSCKQCDGAGCTACQGLAESGQGQGKGDQLGNGGGEGQGQGARPEQDDDVAFRNSQKRLKVNKGKIVITGAAGGPNSKSRIQQSIRAEPLQGGGSEDNPLTDQTLSKKHRENARQYFDALKEKQ